MPIRLFARRVLHTTMTGLLASALALTLTGCSSTPPQPEQRKAPPAKTQTTSSVSPSQVLEMASQRQSPERESLVFLLWGSYAQRKGALIDGNRHCVLRSVHPSPLSAHRGFLGCGHFSAANRYLEAHGQAPVDWSLPA